MARKTMDAEHRQPEPDREKQVLRVGWLIDGCGGPVAADQVVIIDQGRIRSIEPWHPALCDTLDPVDLTDATLLPALMDAHVHLAFSGTLDENRRRAQLQQNPEEIGQVVNAHLQDHLDNGVIAVRDGGDKGGHVLKAKRRQKTPVYLAATCWAWHAAGRYGAMIGRTPDPGESLLQAVERSCLGTDHIKLIQSGINSLKCFGSRTAPQFAQEQLFVLSRFAKSHGLPIMAHANGPDPVESVLKAGCASIEHGYFMGADNLMRMADHQVFWVPTAAPMAALARPGLLTAEQADVARRTLEHQVEQIALARQSGVRIALGTDAGSLGVDHGVAVRRELALFMSAGMSLSQAVCCASTNVAQLLGLDDRGGLKAGGSADLLVVAGSPEHLPASLENIQGVCIRGVWYKRNYHSMAAGS
jgi:imidazolonepropionase-like amidohydrolase